MTPEQGTSARDALHLARAAAREHNWLRAVAALDALSDAPSATAAILVARAALRENVGDLAGGLDDLRRAPGGAADGAALVKARMLARAGFMDEAAEVVIDHEAGFGLHAHVIDALHHEAAVRADLEAWRGRLAEGAVVAFHDSNQPGPNAVIREELASGRLRGLGYRDSLFAARLARPTDRDPAAAGWIDLLEREGDLFENWMNLDRARVEEHVDLLLDRALEEA